MSYGYRERNEAKCEVFRSQLQAVNPEDVVYLDEAGLDNREDYLYGYCEKGKRFEALRSGRRTERVS